ncbi:MAG: hypothetical protein B7X06_03215 [Verrucomicrobia bacterium 21-51-4]|nr:MAG: hypothetical protein B7X06_03215 [Verrucomicrobia bacterium 21-51-4]
MLDAGRPSKWVGRSSVCKEDIARSIAARDGIKVGPICLLKSMEMGQSFEIHRNRGLKKLVLEPRLRPCRHLYSYQIHPQLGFMHTRVQTWLPFTVKICINGREWLCRQMDRLGLGYLRRDNCLIQVASVARTQRLLDKQLDTDWPKLLDGLVAQANPVLPSLFELSGRPVGYYWSMDQSEWASDIMFRSPAALEEVYPKLIRQGIQTLGSGDVMRFLGRKLSNQGAIHGCFKQEVVSDLKTRPEGVRVKHRVRGNSVKMYNKQGSVLRVETTINEPRGFKVFRGTESEPEKKAWRKMRKGVADVRRRAQVSQATNERYLEALATMDTSVTVEELLGPLSRRIARQGRRYRGLHVMESKDGELLAAVARGEFTINGFRNVDIRELLFGRDPKDKKVRQRRSGQVGRGLALLRAHGLIKRVSRTQRWLLTEKGRQAATLVSNANIASIKDLIKAAA